MVIVAQLLLSFLAAVIAVMIFLITVVLVATAVVAADVIALITSLVVDHPASEGNGHDLLIGYRQLNVDN